MKTLLTLIAALTICGCAKPKYPVLRLIYYDPRNNRVDEHGALVTWTNWAVGIIDGTNVVKIFQAKEGE